MAFATDASGSVGDKMRRRAVDVGVSLSASH